MTASARYLYCVLPADGAASAVRAPALDGGPVLSIRHRDIAALTHVCAPEPYQGSETEVRGWIAAHNAVIEEAWKSAGTVLPMSFDVIVRGDSGHSAEANVAGWLEEHHAALRSRLQALRGRVEVGVQILRDADNSAGGESAGDNSAGSGSAGDNSAGDESAGGEPGEAEAPRVRPRGHAYFARHQQQREQREQRARLEREAEAAFCHYG